MITVALVAGEVLLKGLSSEAIKKIEADLTLPNPKYQQALAFSRNPKYATAGIPSTLTFYDNPKADVITVPRGYFESLKGGVNKFVCSLSSVPCKFPPYLHKPRVWQKEVLDHWKVALREKPSWYDYTAQATPGSGKTVCGLMCAALLGQKTLVLVHTDMIMQAWLADAASMFGGKLRVGIIKGSTRPKGDEHVVIAMVQTLRNQPVTEWAHAYGLVIADECHRAPSFTFFEILKSSTAPYRMGLTATPTRSDRLDPLISWVCGPIRTVAERDEDATVPIRVFRVSTGISLTLKTESQSKEHAQSTLWLRQMRNSERDKLVLAWLEWVIAMKICGPILIVTMRNEYSQRLRDIISICSGNIPFVFHSKLKPQEREDYMREAKAGNVHITIATATMLAEGTNIPCWRHLLLCQTFSSPVLTRQVVGRVERAYAGKKFGYVWDLTDNNRQCRSQWEKRLSVYESINAEITRLTAKKCGKSYTFGKKTNAAKT